jgi:3-phosphoshikimate 1-carboxyvinyltransferase
MTINGSGKVKGGVVEIDASTSSQFVSALLLMAPATELGITIKNIGQTLPSQPHIDMTISMLRLFGATVEVNQDSTAPSKTSWRVLPGKLTGQDLIVEPDLSNAAPFMAAAMVCGGTVVIRDWPKESTQPGDQLREIFTRMGAKVEFTQAGLSISSASASLNSISGIDIDLHDVGELTPSIAAVAALASTPSTLRNIGHLRLHETDRLSALATEINKLGGEVIESATDLVIKPRALNVDSSQAPYLFNSYEDHRMATAGAIIGLAVPGVVVENIETTKKTLPNFPKLWSQMLGSATKPKL